MQTLTLEGYLAADPSILSAQGSGRKRASFRVLETTRFRRADGAPGERTTGFNCVCFNESTTEKYIQPFARKGTRVVLVGHVENDVWRGKDGVEHYDLSVVVSDIRLKNRHEAAPGAAEATEVGETDGRYDPEIDLPF
ncbi:single-stranded DNA-binding protein [Brevundimonas bacteroides]|uniref:single-stranded DNA-binding protein n=1 Tax=Brevundimonas bacteroides TaxID=74311 RepID=UPI000496BA32|nr:single-stranded DNA-binding protein [Brevundimonas bacteroides]